MSKLTTGARGKTVKSLQEALVFAGMGGRLKASGTFDEATADAVRAFQKKAGLRADGIASPATLETLGRVIRRGRPPIRPQPDHAPFLKREADAFKKTDTTHRRLLSICAALPGKAYERFAGEVRENRARHRAFYESWRSWAGSAAKFQGELARIATTDPARAQFLNREIRSHAVTAHHEWKIKREYVVKLEELLARFNALRNEAMAD